MLAHQFGRLKAQLSSSVLNQVANVASCCCYPKISYTLNQTETCLDWLGYIARLKGTSKQVVMSAEGFSKTDAELGRLASDLSQLSTRIVMVYIPFYDWIASVYRGTHKETFSPTDFAHWLTDKTMEFWKNNRFNTSVHSRYAAHFSDIRVHTLGPSLMADIACDDLNASKTCSWFKKSVAKAKNVRTKGSTAGKCLDPAQQQKLENLSIELHRATFGIFSPPPFPTSDFHDQASHCFGNK